MPISDILFPSDWHIQTYNDPLDTGAVSEEAFCQLLRKFYCEASPQTSEARTKKLGQNAAKSYHKNTLKNIRSGLNRHLADIGRNIDIVHGANFKPANRTLDGFMKEQTKSGMSRPTEHKPIIVPLDLQKISNYLCNASSNPVILRQCVWFSLGLHFVTRGLEFHHQLRTDSFEFHTDGDDTEYVTLTHETQQKNFQGGLTKQEAPSDRRMYATGKLNCPVAMLRLLISKTDKSATGLFNSCVKEAIVSPASFEMWFTNSPLAKRTYCNFMADICKSSSTSGMYTAHSLRATAIQAMNDQGFEARHIMYMSGHRNESSIKSYCRNPSISQKKQLSTTLSEIAEAKPSIIAPHTSGSATLCEKDVKQSVVTPPTSTVVSANTESSGSASEPVTSHAILKDLANTVFQNGTFSNCAFHISLSNPAQ